jgi:hypothetical protein
VKGFVRRVILRQSRWVQKELYPFPPAIYFPGQLTIHFIAVYSSIETEKVKKVSDLINLL